MKQLTKTLTACILLITVVVNLCGCFRKNDRSTREVLEPQVIEYVKEKYGFKPDIQDWYTESFRSKCDHYVYLYGEGKKFMVHVDFYEKFTDNYESDAIDEAVRRWIDERLPGIYYAHVEDGFFAKDEKYNGDVWDFFKSHNKFVRITATYVQQSFSNGSSVSFMTELDGLGIRYDYTFLSCPSEESAKIVCGESFPNEYIDIMYYTPYIDESLSLNEPFGQAYYTYGVRSAEDCLYFEVVANGSEPVPYSQYSIHKSKESMSDLCPTYKISSNYSGGNTLMNLLIFIPLSSISINPMYQEYYGSNKVDNMRYVYGNTPDGDPYKGIISVYGEYAVFQLNITGSELYFSIAEELYR